MANLFPQGKLQSEVSDYSRGNVIGMFTSFTQRWAARESGMFISAYLCHQMVEKDPAGQTRQSLFLKLLQLRTLNGTRQRP